MIRLPLLTALAVLSAAAAQAHATLDVAEAAAGAHDRVAVRIGFVCCDEATHALAVMQPAAFAGAASTPAPVLRVAAPGAHAEGAATGAAQADPITVSNAFARANPAPGGASAAYMTIATSGGPDRLIAAESPAAARVELHTHTLDAAGVARMRQVEAIDVAPDAPAELKPGGLHVMLMGLAAPLAPGDALPLTLVFEKAGRVTLTAPVQAVGGARTGGGHNHGG